MPVRQGTAEAWQRDDAGVTFVSLREPKRPFCGRPYKQEHRCEYS